MATLNIKSPNGTIQKVNLYTEATTAPVKKYKYKGVQYHAYLGNTTAFNATKHRIKKNNKIYAIITENVVRTNIPNNAEYHIVVTDKDKSIHDFNTTCTAFQGTIGSSYSIIPNPWYKITNCSIPKSGIINGDIPDSITVATEKETHFEFNIEAVKFEDGGLIYYGFVDPLGTTRSAFGSIDNKYVVDMFRFKKNSDTEFGIGLYMWGNDPVTFKTITFKIIYENKTLYVTRDKSIFNQTGDSYSTNYFNSGTDENTILNKIITDIDSKGTVSFKLVLDVVY